ncbi:NADH dehydrogenase [ubiquinone] 1 beta subcomplex subunit 6-like [Acanthaster planci]|uniref:NADH dehydrogenase [ubiquinone] 1 beta subcomplex subunit 6 n=1 Tax=Acanthaster planci TaxID=133434 RepID=A0A8B7Y7L6_ACAPL|nr:NADH dehydrogenase [ubiquinone] 1 beta subcomplex subunit 6-like [Acanthaster planci]
MAACPPLAKSRIDLRPPAGTKPQVPAWAQNDHVLKNWIKEERLRRRTFLADQVLESYEPRPDPVKPNRLWRAIRQPFWNLLWPLNEATGYRLFYGIFKMKRIFTVIVLPAWVVHYVVKYHVAAVPGRICSSKRPVYPGDEEKAES